MNYIALNEIKEKACGTNADGSSKSIVIAGIQKIDLTNLDKEPEMIMETSSLDSIVDLKQIGAFVYLSFKFSSDTHPDLSLFFRCLEKYYEESNDNETEAIVCYINILPLDLGGEYMISATSPVFWAPEPDFIGDSPKTLRVVYLPENVQYIYSELTDEEFSELVSDATEDDELAEYTSDIGSNTDEPEDDTEANENFENDAETDENFEDDDTAFNIFNLDE